MIKYIKIPKQFFPPIIVGLVILFSILLLNLPLTNVLGYEFSAISAVFLPYLGGLLLINKSGKISKDKYTFLGIISSNYLWFLLIIFLPLLFAFSNTIFWGICPFSSSAYFYFVLTLPSYFFGVVLGYIAIKVTSKFVYVIFSLIYLVVLLLPLIEIYFNPQVYFYTTILGYFPGNIYDEDLSVDLPLITYRLFNIIYFIGIILVVDKIDFRKFFNKALFISTVFIVALLFVLIKPLLGYSTTHETIKKELTCEIRTEHFDIIYSGTLTKYEAENLAYHHEYYFTTLKNELGVTPVKRIVSYIFKDNKQKRRLFGAGNADVAKPWLYNIYTTYDNYDNTLKHELAHVFAAEFGVTPFKVAYMLNPSMIEGFAMMMEDDYNNIDIHYMAALAYNSGYTFPLNDLFDGLKFFAQSSSAAYIYSGSFIKYLKNEYGIKKIIRLYGDLDFEKHFGIEFVKLEDNYFNFLKDLDYDINENEANLYFGRKPIFKRTCARYVAVKLREGWKEYNEGAYSDAEKTFFNIFQYSENYSALVGYVSSLIKTGKSRLALDVLNEEIEKYKNTSYYYNLENILGELFIRNDEPGKAKEIYLNLIKHVPNIRYFINTANRLSLLNESADLLKKYFDGSLFDKYKIMMDNFSFSKHAQFVPALITLSTRLDENYDNFINNVKMANFVDDEISSYSAFKVTQLAVENMDYSTAVHFCEIAIAASAVKNIEIYKRYLNKIDWIIENSNNVKSKIVYNN